MEHVLVAATADARIAQLAAAQHGVVSLDQLREAGLGIGAVNTRARAGRLHRLHRGVFAVGHTHLSHTGRCVAALLSLGHGSSLSHSTAGAQWAIRPSAARTIHVTVPTPGGRLRRPGVVIHRSTTLRPEDVDVVNGVPVTSVARTLLDLAGVLAPGPLERAVEQALVLRVFDLASVRSVIAANPTRRGAATLRRTVDTIHHEPRLQRSELEALMRDLCDRARIARPEVNVHVEGLEVDCFWRAERLIVETDGHETHGTRIAFERDRARDARLTALGYRVLRFTHRQLTHDGGRVARTLAALLQAPQPATGRE